MTTPTPLVESTETIDVKLTIDVTYLLNGESAGDIIARLTRMCERAIGAGMLSGETAAEVYKHSMEVVRVNGPSKISVDNPFSTKDSNFRAEFNTSAAPDANGEFDVIFDRRERSGYTYSEKLCSDCSEEGALLIAAAMNASIRPL